MNCVFFGSSDFSIHALRACLDESLSITLVVTTPDSPKGRGLEFSATPVKIFAQEKGLRVEAPESLKKTPLIEEVHEMKPELFVVSSYGKIIPQSWLDLPSNARLNVHPSLLPKYRGAAPINWPILNGDAETGISIADVTNQLDAGELFYQERMPLDSDINAEQLTQILAAASYRVLRSVLAQAKSGKLSRTAQDESKSNYARKLTKEDGAIDWNADAIKIHNQVRGLLPWPIAFTYCQGEVVQVLRSKFYEDNLSGAPGQILESGGSRGLVVKAGKGALALELVRPAGKKEMKGTDFANGRRLKPGGLLGA